MALSAGCASSLPLSGVSRFLLFTGHFTAISERAQLCWDGHWGGCSATVCSSGGSDSSWVSLMAFRHSLKCFPEAPSFTLPWHGRERRERLWSEMTDTLAGDELISGGTAVYKWRAERIRALETILRLLVYLGRVIWGANTSFHCCLQGLVFISPVHRSSAPKSYTWAFLSLSLAFRLSVFQESNCLILPAVKTQSWSP